MASRNLAPDISILIVSWNTCALTEARLDSILGSHLYRPDEENGVPLLYGQTGGGCAMTSGELSDLVGGCPQDKGRTFYLEDAAYIERIEKLGYWAAVLRDLRVTHAGVRTMHPSLRRRRPIGRLWYGTSGAGTP